MIKEETKEYRKYRKPKEQTLLFIYKNSPARLGSESAPRGGQGSRARAAEPGGPGGSAACALGPLGWVERRVRL